MKLNIKKGTTSKTIQIFVLDSSSSVGAGLTGLIHNSSSLVAYYLRDGDASPTVINLVDATVGAWTSSGFKEVSAANMPGVYELGLPNALLASGVDQVIIMLKGASNMAPVLIEIQLVDNIEKDTYDIVNNATYGNNKLVRSTTPANTLDVDGSGEITAENMRGTDGANTTTPPTVGAIADQVWEEAIADHSTGSTFGGKNQKVVPSETLNDYKADVSGLATSGALGTHDGKLDTAQADLNTITGADGTTLATNQGNYAPSKAGDSMGLADDAITPAKYNNAAAYIPYNGGIWIDSGASNTNTVVGVDGLPSNPVSTFVAARILADAIGLQKYYITNHSNLTLAATHQDWTFEGIGLRNRINLGGQDVNDSFFYHIILSGTQGGTQKIEAKCSYLNGITDLNIIATNVWLTGNNTLKATTLSIIDHWSSNVPGQSTPELTFQAGETSIGLRHGSGGIKVNNMTSAHTMSLETDGQLIVDATCNSGNISARGNMDVADNGTSMNITKTAVWNTSQSVQSVTDFGTLVADIWNALTSGMTTANSIGKKLADWVLGSDSKVVVSSDIHSSGQIVEGVDTDVGITQAAADKVFGASGAVIPEPSAGAPPATPKPREVFGWLWAHFRNKGTLNKTTGEAKIYNDAGTEIAKGTDSDDNTTFIKGKLGAP